MTTTTTSPARQMANYGSRSRHAAPAPELDELAWTAPEPAPPPAKAVPNDPTAAVVKALIAGPDPQKTVSDLIELTGLKRGDVVSALAALANAGRVIRAVDDILGVFVVRWSLAAMTLTLGQLQAAGIRPAIAAVPVAAPRRIIGRRHVATGSDLDLLIRSGRPHAATARELRYLLSKPGRRGVLTALHLIEATPAGAIADMLGAWFKAQLPKATWAAMLTLAWFGSSSRLVEGDGDIKEWFKRADLLNPPPFMAKWLCSAEELPDVVTLYRGGSSRSEFIRRGFSWSEHKDTAAVYASDRVAQYGGNPVVVTAEVPTTKLVMATKTSEAEYVTFDEHVTEDCALDRAEIEQWVDQYAARRQRSADDDVCRLVMDDDASWCGWTGE